MLELILPALAGGGLLWGRHGFKRRRRLQGWRQALEMCGLEVEESAGTWTPRRLMLKGKAGPLEIRIESMGDDKKGARLAVLVPGPADFAQVKIRRELHRLFRREIEVGDKKFDDRFYVTGPPLLVRALLDVGTAGACLARLGQSREAVDFNTLAKVMESEQGDLAVIAAHALGTIGESAAEPLLIQALQREHRDLRIAAAKALGRLGSTAAVLPLQEAAERSPLNLDLRKATRESIAEIQTRLAGASLGQLSLAEAEAGQLSLAVDPAGQLSISGGKELS